MALKIIGMTCILCVFLWPLLTHATKLDVGFGFLNVININQNYTDSTEFNANPKKKT